MEPDEKQEAEGPAPDSQPAATEPSGPEEQHSIAEGEGAPDAQPDGAEASVPEEQHPIAEMGTPDDVSPPRGSPFPIVGIGASAGGLEACIQLLRELPSDTDMAYIVVLHLDPNQPSQLASILSGSTAMPVETINHGMRIEPNHVYVLPPNADVTLKDGALMLSKREHGPHMPIDTMLLSLASEQGGRSVAVVLSGNDSDGTEGVLAVKGECGVTFAQEESSARFTGMPRHAIATGVVDFVLPPNEIAQELARIGKHPYVIPPEPGQADQEILPDGDGELKRLFALLQATTAVDFTNYKQTTVRRRIGRRMVVHRLRNLSDYVSFAQRNPGEIKELFRDLLIVVTGFFREPETFTGLKELLVQSLGADRKEALRVWVPGCATGEEVYSLAICLHEALEQAELSLAMQLFGTDISEFALARAREGIYSNIITQHVSLERLKKFFMKVDSGYQISKAIRESCIFARQDVTADPPFSHLDVVSCRNVLIYMDAKLQRKIIPTFHYSLKPNGLLLLGTAEAVSGFTDLFEPTERQRKIYRRKNSPVRLNLDTTYQAPNYPDVLQQRAPAPFTASELQKRVDRIIQQRYAPGAVVVNSDLQILHFRGHTSRYLDAAPGEASLNVLRMARDTLIVPLRRGLREASQQNTAVRENAMLIEGDEQHTFSIEITPIAGPASERQYFLIVFDDKTPPRPTPPPPEPTQLEPAEMHNLVHQLRGELNDTREQVRNLNEDHAAHLEELQAANEEVRSANEELQSTNEELSTTKEELQSANEELTTVNDELRTRNLELSSLNDDLKNVLTAVNVAILITDNDLRVRRFTDATEKLLDLRPLDIGRKLTHIHGPFPAARLEQLAREALETLHGADAELKDEKGGWYSITARPFRTGDDRIDGAIFSFVNIDALKRGLEAAEQARDHAEALIETVREPLVVIDADLRVQRATNAFYDLFQVTPEETEGRLLYDLGNGQWNIPRLRELLGDALFRNAPFQDLEVEHYLPHVGKKTMRLNGRRIPLPDHQPRLAVLAIEDVTTRKEAAEASYRALFESAKDAIVVLDANNGLVTDVNPTAIQLTGYSRERLIGKPFSEAPPFRTLNVDELLKELETADTAWREAAALRTFDGQELSVAVLANRVFGGSRRVVQLNIRDVSDRKRAEDALRQSEERFRLFVDSVRDYALFLMDNNGNVISWNAGAARMLGYSEEEILGRNGAILYTPEDVEHGEPRKELDKALREGRSEDERWHIRKDGSRFWGSGAVTLVRDESGRLRGFTKIMHDDTERKRSEEALQIALKEKELLLREIHHRVKNNLQVITSMLNMQAIMTFGGATASLEQIRDRVRAIARIHELLYQSRSLTQVNMQEHAEALIADLFQVYDVDSLAIRVKIAMRDTALDIERAIPCGLVLNELVSNALKHAFRDRRRGELSISMYAGEDGWHHLNVSDNGVGFPKDINLKEMRSVGLWLVNIFVEQLQGDLQLLPGEGTTFQIRFPSVRREAE